MKSKRWRVCCRADHWINDSGAFYFSNKYIAIVFIWLMWKLSPSYKSWEITNVAE